MIYLLNYNQLKFALNEARNRMRQLRIIFSFYFVSSNTNLNYL